MVDRPTAETPWICLAVAAILLAAVALLYVSPGRTDDLFAWTIVPEIMPLFMGAAYGAGAYFFGRATANERWHRVSAGFLPIALFAALMLLATLVHFDKLNGGDAPTVAAASFYAWTVVYVLSPFVVAGVWVRNRGRDAGKAEIGDARVPPAVRRLARVSGAALASAGTLFFIAPSVAIDVWAWELTPLTAPVLAAFMIEGAAVAIMLSLDSRWSAWRILTQTAIVGAVLLSFAIVRAWDDLDHSNPLTWLLSAAVPLTAVGALWLHLAMENDARAATRRDPT